MWADGATPVRPLLVNGADGRLTFRQPKSGFETWATDEVQVGEIRGLSKLPAGDQLKCIREAISAGRLRKPSQQGGSSSGGGGSGGGGGGGGGSGSGGGGSGGGQKRSLDGGNSSQPAAKKQANA